MALIPVSENAPHAEKSTIFVLAKNCDVLYRKIKKRIDGARQIGKSYIIRHVGEKMFPNDIEINMEEDKLGDRDTSSLPTKFRSKFKCPIEQEKRGQLTWHPVELLEIIINGKLENHCLLDTPWSKRVSN